MLWCQIQSLISIHLMLRFIFFDIAIFDEIQDHFNTSHVTVYHDRIGEDKGAYFIFQYISCYGLSFPTLALIFAVPEFQYISCYGLSLKIFYGIAEHRKFQYISCYGLSLRNIFTIHILILISIHLMLRFI